METVLVKWALVLLPLSPPAWAPHLTEAASASLMEKAGYNLAQYSGTWYLFFFFYPKYFVTSLNRSQSKLPFLFIALSWSPSLSKHSVQCGRQQTSQWSLSPGMHTSTSASCRGQGWAEQAVGYSKHDAEWYQGVLDTYVCIINVPKIHIYNLPVSVGLESEVFI